MIVKNYVKKQQYYDSVFLMRIAGKIINIMEGIRVSAGMGTPLNKSMLEEMHLLDDQGRQAGPNDLIVAVAAEDEYMTEKVRDEFMQLLTQKTTNGLKRCRSLDLLCRDTDSPNLALISVAGEFAGAEAKSALMHGLNVFMFSDNVALEEEVKLKRIARDRGLFMMGPSCGLCFINGIAIGLCSKVRRGNIGIVGASGSGMQEVMTIIHRYGMGISHAIGTGGRDLSEAVGGITMIQGIRALEEDEMTSVIVLISKPPAKNTLKKVLDVVKDCVKPVVIMFINGDADIVRTAGAIPTSTFEETALRAIALAGGKPYVHKTERQYMEELLPVASAETEKLAPGQRYLRGIYCGGTLAEEALSIVQKIIGCVYTNIDFSNECLLNNPFESYRNTIIDIGEEIFTRGRPHVAIDPTLRTARFVKEARDPETAVILLDFLLGYAVHENPAGIMAGVIREEKERAYREGRHLCVVASICGTDLDPQGYEAQKRTLLEAGVIVMDNNGTAARLAAEIIKKHEGR